MFLPLIPCYSTTEGKDRVLRNTFTLTALVQVTECPPLTCRDPNVPGVLAGVIVRLTFAFVKGREPSRGCLTENCFPSQNRKPNFSSFFFCLCLLFTSEQNSRVFLEENLDWFREARRLHGTRA